MAVLTTALTRLRADFNTRFPNRDKASDGWIGDTAHQQEVSGHNPDESGRAEYQDADRKDEVRAIDVDVDFREAGVNAQQVVDSILRTPADLARLRYIIYNRRVWSRSNGWAPRAYNGASPHIEHIHFSGDPATDEDGRPWDGVLNVAGTLTAADVANLRSHITLELRRAVQTITRGTINPLTNPADNPWINDPGTITLNELAAGLASLGATVKGDTDRRLEEVSPVAPERPADPVTALSVEDVSVEDLSVEDLAERLRTSWPAEKVAELKAAL